MRLTNFITTGVLVVRLVLHSGTIFAASPDVTAHGRGKLYVGFAFPYNALGGGFNGRSVLAGTTQIVHVPKIGSAYGYRAVLGLGFARDSTSPVRETLEISYVQSTHNATWTGARSEADYHTIDLDAKAYFRPNKSLQPFFLFGVSVWSKLAANDAAEAFPNVGRALFYGQGFNGGFGVAYFVHPRLSISGDVILRYIYLDVANDDIDSPINGFGATYDIGLTYTLFK